MQAKDKSLRNPPLKPSAYLETTVVSYYCSRPSRDIVISARQQITQLWWDNKIHEYSIFISDLVQEEAGKGDDKAAAKRLNAISEFPILEVDTEASRIAKDSSRTEQFPPNIRKMQFI